MMKSISLACLLSLFAVPLAAAEWVRTIEPEAQSELSISNLLPRGDGYVITGVDAEGAPRWVQVDARGQARLVPGIAAAADALHVGADRYLVRVSVGPGSCRLAFVDGNGGARDVVEPPTEARCDDLPIFLQPSGLDGAGGSWLDEVPGVPKRWGRLQADERVRAIPMPAGSTGYNGFARFAPIPGEAAAFAIYWGGQGLRLAKVGYKGPQWDVAPPGEDRRFGDLLRLADGDVLVVGRRSLAGVDKLWLARYAPDGALRWERTDEGASAGQYFVLQPMAGDRVVVGVYHTLREGFSLHAYDALGDALWHSEYAAETFHGFVPGPGDAAPAATAFLYAAADGVPASALEHRNIDGVRLTRISLPENSYSHQILLANGSLVHSLQVPGLQRRITVHRRDGSVAAGPEHLELVPVRRAPVRGALGANGDSFSLARLGFGPLQLRNFDAAGTLRWRQVLDPATLMSPETHEDVWTERQARLAISDERVCIGPQFFSRSSLFGALFSYHTRTLQCLRRTDGAALYSIGTLPDPPGPQLAYALLPAVGLRPDGRVDLVEQRGNELYRTTVTADGAGVARTRLVDSGLGIPERGGSAAGQGPNLVAELGGDGSGVVLIGAPFGNEVLGASFALLQIDADGQSRAFLHPTQHDLLLRVQRLDDGDWLLHSRRQSEHRLTRLAPDGVTRWTRSFETIRADGITPRQTFDYTFVGEHVLVSTHVPEAERVKSRLELFDAGTSQTRWVETQTLLAGRGVRALRLDEPRGLALVLRDTPDRPVLTAYALSDGAVLGKRVVDCVGDGCSPLQLALAADGSLRSFGGGADVARLELGSTLHPAAAGQPALLGTWYAPGTSGQGLLLDYGAASGDLIGGWFTFDGDDLTDVRGLRWFTLGGSITAGATSAELAIYANAQGQFAAGPQTAATRVGAASLRLHECNELLISYHFTQGENAGLHGELSLARLTPSVNACTDADGHVTPPAVGQPVADLAASRSGAWYATAQSGQGLLFDLRAPSATTPGHLVGGWFTYDPAGLADDPAAQHWFLLDGDLVPDAAGRVAVPIYRAVGGSFDRRPTDNVKAIGSATLQFTGCSRATLDYRFDDSDIAAEYAARSGRIELTRLLPCPP
jgi:hypothetical protein